MPARIRYGLLTLAVALGILTLPPGTPPGPVTGDRARGFDEPDEALRWIQMAQRDEFGNIDPNGFWRAKMQLDAMRARQARAFAALGRGQLLPSIAGINNGSWTWIGPGNVGGRTRAISINPTNTSDVVIGGVAGGIWRTLNAGASWSVINDFMANLAVSTIVRRPGDASLLLAGTGEGFFNSDAIRGAGVFRSANGGAAWSQLPSTVVNSNFEYVNRLAFSADGTILLAATRAGIFRSTDAGDSWLQTLSLSNGMTDVKFLPGSNSGVVASGQFRRAYFSNDGGVNWFASSTPATGGTTSLHRIELGVTPNAPLWVYASFAAGGSSSSPPAEVWRSTDGGATYVLISTPGQLGAQGWYDNAVWVDPTNANHVVIGGVSRYRSTDGVNFSQMGSAAPGIHVDHHAIVSDPGYDGITNRKVYYGNDGGIYRLEDATAGPSFPFTRLNNNYGVTQFYAGAGHAASGRIVGGTQDNGTLVYTPANGPQNWTTMFGADGGFSAADQTNANYLYGETQWLGVHRSANAGLGSTIITGCAGPAPLLDACNFTTNFISPILLDPNDQNRLYGGGRSLWRNSDARNSSNWSAVKGPTATSVNISSIAVAPGNPDLIWIGHGSVPSASGSGGDVFKTTNGTDAAPFWSKMDDNSPGLPNRVATSIAIDPASSDTVYVAFGGYTTGNLWKTTNGGITWTNVSGTGPGTLPSVPVRSVVVHPTVPNWVYVGTDVGVFASEDGGATWQVPHDGPANVAVFQLFWMNTTLVAVTHGRGMYTADAAAAPPAAFNKVAPLSGGVNQPAGVAASWQASTGATSYEVCYDQTDDDSCGTGWRPVGNDTLAFLGEVRGGGTYFWQVRARNTGGTVEANGGTWWSLTVESIGKLGPAFGTGDLPTSVPLSWQSSAGSATYEYCVDTINNQRCDSAWVPVGGATGAVVPVGAGGTYFWQVRAVSAGGPVELNEGAWWRFSTSGAFSKVGPGSDTSGHPMDVLLSWQASTGATGYEYCVDLTNNGTCDGAWVSAGTNTSALVSGLTAGATYYWQVRALTAGGPVAANSGVWWHFTRQPAPAMLASLAQHRPLVLGTRRRLGDPRTLFPTIA